MLHHLSLYVYAIDMTLPEFMFCREEGLTLHLTLSLF